MDKDIVFCDEDIHIFYSVLKNMKLANIGYKDIYFDKTIDNLLNYLVLSYADRPIIYLYRG